MIIPSSNFVTLCGQGGPLASAGLYLAPIPTIKQISTSGTVGNLPLLPYSSMAGNTFIWSVYGLLKQEVGIWSCNVFGFALAIFYCFTFVKNLPKEGKSKTIMDIATPTLPGSVKQHVQAVLAVIASISTLALFKPFGKLLSENLIGNIGVAICVIMFASPLSVIKVVLQTKSAKSIPLPFTLLTTLNCLMWTVFGWFKLNDVNVYLPNALGLCSGFVQIVLKLIFGSKDNALPSTKTSPGPDIV